MNVDVVVGGYPNQGFSGPGGAVPPSPGYPGYSQTPAGYGDGNSSMGQYPKQEMSAIGYNQTKPLSHYPAEGMAGAGHTGQPGPPSSLQQLQNQVASHFNPMHISQTQHVQLAQGPHRLQVKSYRASLPKTTEWRQVWCNHYHSVE